MLIKKNIEKIISKQNYVKFSIQCSFHYKILKHEKIEKIVLKKIIKILFSFTQLKR